MSRSRYHGLGGSSAHIVGPDDPPETVRAEVPSVRTVSGQRIPLAEYPEKRQRQALLLALEILEGARGERAERRRAVIRAGLGEAP